MAEPRRPHHLNPQIPQSLLDREHTKASGDRHIDLRVGDLPVWARPDGVTCPEPLLGRDHVSRDGHSFERKITTLAMHVLVNPYTRSRSRLRRVSTMQLSVQTASMDDYTCDR